MDTIPVLRKDATVTISLQTGLIQRLQGTLTYLLEGHSQQEIDTIKAHIDSNNLSAWELSVVSLTQLLNTVMKTADSNGLIEHKPISDVFGSSMG